MSQYSFNVNLTPMEVMNMIRRGVSADLVYEDFYDIGGGKYCGNLIFEKYFIRVSSRVALTVMVNNFGGITHVTSVSTGSSQSVFFKFDWGAANSFAESVRNILANYIVG